MLKIKGLKKKKKGKKGKHKEEVLFDPEELEQLEKYRKEHQQKVVTGEVSETVGEGSSNTEQSEEWKKFQALTAGVDDILKKTQGDLNRIKTTSYFQRKPPGPSTTPESSTKQSEAKWTKFEDGSITVDKEPRQQDEQIVNKVKQEEPPPLFETEEEETSDQDDDIFDTSYVDVVASGNVKLAYIPDSPTEEETGPDPFDTSIVDKVIKVDPKRKNLVSLGCAVEVLTGKVDKPIPVTEALPTKRKRAKKQDLLLESLDKFEAEAIPIQASNEVQSKTILDEEPEFVPEQINLSINLAAALPPPTTLIENNKPSALVSHTYTLADKQVHTVGVADASNSYEPDALDDEFAALAQESVLKEVAKEQTVLENNNFNDIDNATEDGGDPFDTTFASNVLPGKFELRLIEEEILFKEYDLPKSSVSIPTYLELIPSVTINDSKNEHNFLEEDQAPLTFKHRDLLGGSTTDLTKIVDSPIEPSTLIKNKDDSTNLIYSDPFDTSVVDILVAPGKTELKFLERELLEDEVSHIEDNAFDPRADSSPSKPPVRPDQLPVGEKRLSFPKVVAFNVTKLQAESDLLTVNHEENSKVSKPLTPYYANPEEINSRPSCESEHSFVDPFDTNFVSCAPGKVELKLIESELANDSISDDTFNPRDKHSSIKLPANNFPKDLQQHVTLTKKENHLLPDELQPDILSEDSVVTGKLHTPVVPRRIEVELEQLSYLDPFDTSIVKDVLPGKAELKQLEIELIQADLGTSVKRSYTDPDFNPRNSLDNSQSITEANSNFIDQPVNFLAAEKPLTPQSATSKISFELGCYTDPFDTSCVENLVPGKTELKLLESELFN